jgi:preprotein translocase subunit SecA
VLHVIKKVFGTKNDRDLKNLRPLVQQINALGSQMSAMTDDELKAQTPKLRAMLTNGKTLTDILPEAFATVREASLRVLKMRHFDVQMMGGIVLSQGKIAEMKTGEGKTLTATLPLYLYGLNAQGAHLVTVNDYLASRDAKEMAVLFNWLGLSVGCVVHNMSDRERKAAYACDITYGTNNEFAFDYLRDNMKFDLEQYVQREHVFCIVDEVDSILIDEARTPLLISGPSEGDPRLYHVANQVIPRLKRDEHFTLDEKSRSIVFTDDGVVTLQSILNLENLYDIKHSELLHHLNQALKAHQLFQKDKDYVVREGKVIIVDEFTGRLKEGSRWSDGLHQSVEAKEGVEIKSENQTLASITFQNYFRLYKTLSGMTGTADTEAEEFKQIYKLDVVVIPTNVPITRLDQADVIYKDMNAKYKAVGDLIESLHKKGQPCLVGTISIDSSEKLSAILRSRNIPHEVLNAKQHEREASIVENAGQFGAVTIATNMAGRGTDIKLPQETKAVGGLFILGTERHESRRIDNQLRGRSGRQGDPGESKFFLSLEDDLMRIFGSNRIQSIMTTLGMKDDEPIEHKMITNAIAKAQKKVEGHNFEIRKHLLKYDDMMNEQRQMIYGLRKQILSDSANVDLVEEMIEDVAEFILTQHRPEKKTTIDQWDWAALQHSARVTYKDEKIIFTLEECHKDYNGDIDHYFIETGKALLKQKFSNYEADQVRLAVREILLSTLDQFWKDHLLSMDNLKEGINLRAYAQKDPLTEYKRESFLLFEKMRENVKLAVIENVFSVKLYTQAEIEELRHQHEERLKEQLAAFEAEQVAAQKNQERQAIQEDLKRQRTKIGRNDECPCGSGKKYKSCHGA